MLLLSQLILQNKSEPFNPNIAHVFYLAGFIESWGRGIEKICEVCVADGVPLPEYIITGNSIMIKFIAPENRVIRIGANGTNQELSEKELLVYSIIKENSDITQEEISKKAEISRRTVQRIVNELKEKFYIQRKGSTRGEWMVLDWRDMLLLKLTHQRQTEETPKNAKCSKKLY